MQLKSEFDKLFEDLKEDDKSCEMEGAEVFRKLETVFYKNTNTQTSTFIFVVWRQMFESETYLVDIKDFKKIFLPKMECHIWYANST